MSGLVAVVAAEVRHAAVMLGYWLRPFDMIADKRRWRWDEQARCGLPAMTDEAAARLRAALVDLHGNVERGVRWAHNRPSSSGYAMNDGCSG